MFNKRKKEIEALNERVRLLENKIISICGDHSFDYFSAYSSPFAVPECVWVKCMKCGFEKRIKRVDMDSLKVKQRELELEKLKGE